MSTISIRKISITSLDTDAVVNAANESLWAGGGVCGAIFRAAGYEQLKEACSRIGHCDTGSAVITPGFGLKARYIIHAVGPVWQGGRNGEPELLYGAYVSSLELAAANHLRSIGFPLISSGIYGYPVEGAWQAALSACRDFLDQHPDVSMEIVFAVLSDDILETGRRVLSESGIYRNQPAVVRFYDEAEDELLKFAVIITRTNGRWVFCKHRERETYEIPGGHREAGEAILETAKRELYEETGALEFTLKPVCVYSVTAPDNFNGEETFGMLYHADIRTFEEELHSEIESILITDHLVDHWTYPQIQPKLIEEAERRGMLN